MKDIRVGTSIVAPNRELQLGLELERPGLAVMDPESRGFLEGRVDDELGGCGYEEVGIVFALDFRSSSWRKNSLASAVSFGVV